MKEKRELSRRAFLGTAAVVGAGAAVGLAGCTADNSTTEEEPESNNTAAVGLEATIPAVELVTPEETIDCDVLVIGGGASGCMAALRAAEEGATVVLVEKSDTLGGCYNLSWASCTYGSKYAPADDPDFGIEDPDAYVRNWIANSHWRVDGAAIRQLLMTSGEAWDWLADNYEHEMTPVGYNNGYMMLPEYEGRAAYWSTHITAATEENGGQLLLGHTAKSLVLTSGAVTGAIVVDSGGRGIQINAKATSVSTGGYAGNYDMVKAAFGFSGSLSGITHNIGEGLAIAWKAGAGRPDNFGGQMLHDTLTPATNALIPLYDAFPAAYPLITAYLPRLLNVGVKGARFRDESLILDTVAAAYSSAYQGSHHYIILSKKIIDALEQGGLAALGQTETPEIPAQSQPVEYTAETPWVDVYTVLDKVVELGYGFTGATPEELAEKAKMDAAVFAETLANYEQFCTDQDDTEFNKASELLVSYGGEGPYYAITAEVSNRCSFGGIMTSPKYEALKKTRTRLDGLYATGVEAGGNLYNDTYMGAGIALANAAVSGYLCGKAMADYALGV